MDYDSAAIAATYGSVSAVTFLLQLLASRNSKSRIYWSYGGSNGINGGTCYYNGYF
jgi:hypothetical protein